MKGAVPSQVVWALCVAGCLAKLELPPEALETGSAGQQGASDGEPDAGASGPAPCGGQGEVCCEDRSLACGAQLRCDERDRCVPEDPRLCVSDDQCPPGQTCCVAGLLGSCVSLSSDAVCPEADLVITTTQDTLGLYREERLFDAAVPADACAVEKGCVGGYGMRRLLRFSTVVRNQGEADLLIGSPEAGLGFETSSCDAAPYFGNYLQYELIDFGGSRAAAGRMQARCQTPPAGFATRFSCDFLGLWSGFSEVYDPYDYNENNEYVETPCQWVDITDVPAGDYRLRVRIDPGELFTERSDNNQVDFALSIPRLNEPLQACPSTDNPLFGGGVARECGWEAAPLQVAATCSAGQPITVGCPTCTGDPMIRICEGLTACPSTQALGAGDDTSLLTYTDGSTRFGACDFSDPALISCAYGTACPTVDFICPESGAYSWLQAPSYYATSPVIDCDVVEQGAAAQGTDGTP